MNWIRTLRAASTTPLLVAIALAGFAAADFATPNTFVNGAVADADQVNENFQAIAAALDVLDDRVSHLASSAVVGPDIALRLVYGEVDENGIVVDGSGFTPVQKPLYSTTSINSGPWGAPPTTFVQTLGPRSYDIYVVDNLSGGNIRFYDPDALQIVFVPFRFVQFGPAP